MGALPSDLASPDDWARRISAPPVVSSDPAAWPGALVRRWRDVDAAMSQPPLDHHQIALHLGGPKRIRRSGEGPEVSADVALNALTFTSAGRAHSWSTQGPVDFAHLYVQPAKLDRVAEEEFGRDGARVELADAIGRLDPLLASVITEMVASWATSARARGCISTPCSASPWSRSCGTTRGSTSGGPARTCSRRGGCAGSWTMSRRIWRPRSRWTTLRACRREPVSLRPGVPPVGGRTPYAYVLDQRVERAKRLCGDRPTRCRRWPGPAASTAPPSSRPSSSGARACRPGASVRTGS
jgi:AraC family transcriptional regulator